jgi:predicted nucleic acid-binding protein
MSAVLLLDTNVWSHLLLSVTSKRHKVQASLKALVHKYPGAVRATSRVCVAECMVAARRLLDPLERAAAEAAFLAEFANLNLMIVEVTDVVADTAASLRAEALRRAALSSGKSASAKGGKLKLPDAIIAASCLRFDPPAVLVTENAGDFVFLDGGVQKTVADIAVERIG